MPELWERYVKEVDAEQEMWLNSFTKAPLRIPMPPELEYLWEKGAFYCFWYLYAFLLILSCFTGWLLCHTLRAGLFRT